MTPRTKHSLESDCGFMNHLNPNISYFAKTNFREDGKRFGLLQNDRLMHALIVGKTGSGKTNLLTALILQDIQNGRGCVVFDVHGDLIETLLIHIPRSRIRDVVHLNPADPLMNYGYNPVRKVSYEYRSLVVSGLLESFKNLWKSAWGVRLEHILRYIFLTLISKNDSTLRDVLLLIDDPLFRTKCLTEIKDRDVLRFWKSEFTKYTKTDLAPIYNKVGALLVHPCIRRLFITGTYQLSLRDVMDNQKILLVGVSKGRIGADASKLISSILLSAISNAAFSRVILPEALRNPCHLYLDEFQNYLSPGIVGMLSELRKFKISLTLAHQYLHQLDKDIRHAVLGNIGTLIAFRTGNVDAKYFASEFEPVFRANDLTNLSNYEIYLKLMIRGRPSNPFSATTFPFTEILN